jgi:hypothetical protein
MKIEDALRKIRLLRRIIPENGALVSRPKPRLAWSKPSWSDILFGKEDVHLVATPRSRMTWVYWEQMLADFGIALDRFGARASASPRQRFAYHYPPRSGALARAAIVVRRLETYSPRFWLECLRVYLAKYASQPYSLVG